MPMITWTREVLLLGWNAMDLRWWWRRAWRATILPFLTCRDRIVQQAETERYPEAPATGKPEFSLLTLLLTPAGVVRTACARNETAVRVDIGERVTPTVKIQVGTTSINAPGIYLTVPT